MRRATGSQAPPVRHGEWGRCTSDRLPREGVRSGPYSHVRERKDRHDASEWELFFPRDNGVGTSQRDTSLVGRSEGRRRPSCSEVRPPLGVDSIRHLIIKNFGVHKSKFFPGPCTPTLKNEITSFLFRHLKIVTVTPTSMMSTTWNPQNPREDEGSPQVVKGVSQTILTTLV